MPRYRFQWANFRAQMLRGLCRDLGLRGDSAEALREAYGPRPSETFVQEAWNSLLDRWLARDSQDRKAVIKALWDAGVGRQGPYPTSKQSEMEWLYARNRTTKLREVVLDLFIVRGERSDGDGAGDEPFEPSRPATDDLPEGVAAGAAPTPTPTKSLSLANLERRLWDAANSLRGPVDPADFKTYVFPMLFWKWISDTWDHERARAVADFGNNLDPEVEADYHRFSLPEGTHWRAVTTKTDNVGSRIARALGRIEQANPDTLAGIFGDAAWGNKDRLPESSLVALINVFTGLTLNPEVVPHDVLGQAYEYLLKNFADESGKKAGEFFTPRQVVRMIVRILDPQPGETIYDPACGSGGMLVESINTVRAHDGDTRTLRLYGQEVNLTTAAIARMNLFLHEIEDFKIVRGDTLRSPGLRHADGSISQFDIVIANPPFSLANWGADIWAADPRSFCGVPPTKNGDFAWVQHMVSSMAKGGRVGVVMPHGVLFRGGVEARIRQCLVEHDELEAVIGLAPNLFYNTTIPACILVFRASKPRPRRGHVLFVDGSLRFVKARNQNSLTSEDVEAIVTAFHTGDDPDGEHGVSVRLVPLEEIQNNGFDLSIGRYLKAAVAAEIDVAAALANYEDARAARIDAETALASRLKAVDLA